MENIEYASSACPTYLETEHRPLRVLFLEPQPCIRALKYAIGLRHYLEKKVTISFGHMGHPLNELYGFGEEYFDRIVKIDPERIDESMNRFINKQKPHIIHSHNAPDTLTLRAIDSAGGVPIIHDVHEVLSVHSSGFFKDDNREKLARYRKEERRACEDSDGRIYATEGIKEYVQQNYSVESQSSLVFYNYAAKSIMPYCFKEKLSARDNNVHIVYVGCLTSMVNGSHYDLREIFMRIADHGFHIHFYPTRDEITESNETYRTMAENSQFMHYHDPLGYERLLYEMTQYDFGWAGFNGAKNGGHLDIAIQNKIFDYMSSGLPVISFPFKAMRHFIEENGLGLIIIDVDELAEALKNTDICKLRENVMKARQDLTVESNIPELVDFYNRIIELKGD
jgi:glycosyltransferase involved in cell wall biosynthesis